MIVQSSGYRLKMYLNIIPVLVFVLVIVMQQLKRQHCGLRICKDYAKIVLNWHS